MKIYLNQALAEWKDCVKSWESAIAALPQPDHQSASSDADEKMRKQYEENLETVMERMKIAEKNAPVIIPAAVNRAGKMPWAMAKDMELELLALGKDGFNSSVIISFHFRRL